MAAPALPGFQGVPGAGFGGTTPGIWRVSSGYIKGIWRASGVGRVLTGWGALDGFDPH